MKIPAGLIAVGVALLVVVGAGAVPLMTPAGLTLGAAGIVSAASGVAWLIKFGN